MFEVIDKTDEVSLKHCFEVVDETDRQLKTVDKTDEVSSKHGFEVVDETDEALRLQIELTKSNRTTVRRS
ncbi:hypothetical protein [Streptococcus pneumoniae]|uniref:hypothetical protein n=1 Tax=Streptococcus pneumoniae TaxID=1313 RepID=UPI001D029937|nr:hypothetical protein [Streptococcus pneumoniae]